MTPVTRREGTSWRRLVAGLLGLGVTGWATGANAQTPTPAFSNSEAALHRNVLAQRINEQLRVQVAAEAFGVADVVLGTTLTALIVPDNFQSNRAASLSYLVGFGAIDAAAVSSLFLTRDTRSRIFQVIMPATPAVGILGYLLAHDSHPFPRLTAGSLTAGWFTVAILEGINDFSTPTPFSTLRRHQKRIENEQDLSADERRTMHRDLLGSRGPVPRWTLGASALISGAVAISPAFSQRYPQNERTTAALFGGGSILVGLLDFLPGPVGRYERDLETLDISVALAPGGINARGTFSVF
jgi:hypothetical protein